jgi:23S rRNA pseudouridine1911/1915/1917 synthase
MKTPTPIEILFENEDLVAINKPAGIMVHGDGKSPEYTIADWMLETYPASRNVGEPIMLRTVVSGPNSSTSVIMRPGIVHRLDKDTSGVMLLAKTPQGFEHLKQQFKDRTISKTYRAFVYNNIKEDALKIALSIGRSSKDVRRWSAGKDARGELRDALTNFTVLGRGQAEGEHITFIQADPKTGRTHQIRVHAKAIDRPLVGDALYAPGRKTVLGFKRLALHAVKIAFNDLTGARIEVEAPYPEDFTQAIKTFERAL